MRCRDRKSSILSLFSSFFKLNSSQPLPFLSFSSFLLCFFFFLRFFCTISSFNNIRKFLIEDVTRAKANVSFKYEVSVKKQRRGCMLQAPYQLDYNLLSCAVTLQFFIYRICRYVTDISNKRRLKNWVNCIASSDYNFFEQKLLLTNIHISIIEL